ncbi:MAG: L,D-transpeptidase family protein [Halocynthiibacter sp.]
MRIIFAILICVFAVSCTPRKFERYTGPAVTGIVVNKADRKMYLLHEGKVLRSYRVDLGKTPVGDKEFEGDGKTPEGTYIINRRNPNSAFYLSLGISYPNRQDIAEARALGKKPGGDIFIHGGPRPFDPKGKDWTWGCISVSNKEMREIYAMVKNGTPISIYP